MRRSILVVEDNPGYVALYRTVLGSAGYEVRVATTAAEALESIRLDAPGVAICDVHLPGDHDGLWLAAEIQRVAPAVRVVLATFEPVLPASATLRGDVVAHLVKPIAPDDLLRVVGGAMSDARHEPPREAHAPRVAPERTGQHVASVLIVEDNPGYRAYYRAILEPAGYHVSEAATAEDGLAAIRATAPDVALCDVYLPGRDGLWLARQIEVAAPSTAIILATSDAALPASETFLERVTAYLVKPIEAEPLLEAVAEALPGEAVVAAVRVPEPAAGADPVPVGRAPSKSAGAAPRRAKWRTALIVAAILLAAALAVAIWTGALDVGGAGPAQPAGDDGRDARGSAPQILASPSSAARAAFSISSTCARRGSPSGMDRRSSSAKPTITPT